MCPVQNVLTETTRPNIQESLNYNRYYFQLQNLWSAKTQQKHQADRRKEQTRAREGKNGNVKRRRKRRKAQSGRSGGRIAKPNDGNELDHDRPRLLQCWQVERRRRPTRVRAGYQHVRPLRLHHQRRSHQSDRSLRNIRQHDLNDYPIAAADEVVHQLSADRTG